MFFHGSIDVKFRVASIQHYCNCLLKALKVYSVERQIEVKMNLFTEKNMRHMGDLKPHQHQQMIEAAQQYLDTARKHERVVWAKQAHVAKGLEKMAYERKIPFDSRVVARGLLDECLLPLRESINLVAGPRFNTAGSFKKKEGRRLSTQLEPFNLDHLTGILFTHQRKEWSRLTASEGFSHVQHAFMDKGKDVEKGYKPTTPIIEEE